MTRTPAPARRPGPPGGARHAPQRPSRRRGRALVAGALVLAALLAVLLAAAVPAVLDRWFPPPEPDPQPRTVSCAPYGIDATVPARVRGEGGDRGLFDADLFGSGPRDGDRFDLSFEHDGVTGRYHVLAQGVDRDRPVGVVLHLHGDGAFEFDSPQYNVSCLAEVARAHNMVLVVPRTPDDDGAPTWWEAQDRNAAWLRALMEERLLAEHDIDRSRTWLTGYSGGAQLISQELLADHLDLVPGGGAVMLGGGEAPRAAAAEPTPAQLRDLRLHWDVGRDDDGGDPEARFDALSAATRGHAWYEERGFDATTLVVREGIDHFELPEARILDRVLTEARSASGGA